MTNAVLAYLAIVLTVALPAWLALRPHLRRKP
jgi:hypothetical protein